MEEFKKLGLSEDLLRVIKEHSFTEPSEIQRKAIPISLKGKDVIGYSETGSGKTLAFGASIIETTERGKGIQALILTPTRELAEQVADALKGFSRHKGLKIEKVYGGVGIHNQIKGLEKADIVVGTPGRILDHMQRVTLDLFNLKILVLDEADRLVDMGFLPDVEKIIKACPPKRQTLLFSATSSPDIDYIKENYMINPTEIETSKYVDPTKLKQVYYDVPTNMKFSLLVHLLKNDESHLSMVFCNTKMNADIVSSNLQNNGVNAMPIHGGLNQSKRTTILQKFHDEQIKVLVCTDVAARGLDIKNVSHVYNYDSSKNSKEYIHRIGRTARAGKEGMAISIVSERDYENFRRIIDDSSLNISLKELPEFEKIPFQYKSFSNRGRGPRRDYRGQSRGRSFGGRDSGSRSSSSGRSYGDRDSRPSYGGGRSRSFGGRDSSRGKSYGDRDSRPRYGDRDNRQGRSYGDRDSRPRRSFGDRHNRPRQDHSHSESSHGSKPSKPKRPNQFD